MVPTPAPPVTVRSQRDDEADAVHAVTLAAFGDETVAALPAALRAHHLGAQGHSIVALADGTVVGHVGLSRCWIDDERRLVAGLTLSPLSVDPAHQRRGIGRGLVEAALATARTAGEPFVMLEGDPGMYGSWGFEPAADHRVTPPSPRVPAPACQLVVLPGWDPATRGAVVYNDVFWSHDAVGLRGAALTQVRAALAKGGIGVHEV